jgi:hypothetical protein
MKFLRTPIVLALALTLAMPATYAARTSKIELEQATEEIPQELLLDVGIQVLDPGITKEGKGDAEEPLTPVEAAEKGIFKELRRSEARYFAFQLKSTLESTGHWGAVRVLPRGGSDTDVMVTGEIRKSTGLIMTLDVHIEDSTGRVWNNGRYDYEADARAYIPEEDREPGMLDVDDPYQSLFSDIANDMLKDLEKLKEKRILEIRQATRLRFAAALAPEAFGDYLHQRSNGRIKIKRLPAEDDAMMARVDAIRRSEDLLVDTLNNHYAGFYTRMDQPYGAWRAASYEEEAALRRIRRKARKMAIIGGLLTLGGLAGSSGSTAGRVAQDAAIIGGVLTVTQAIKIAKEGKIHKEALKELGASVDAEIAPMLVEVEGRTLRLEGSAQAQYAEWRRLLAEIFREETGLGPEPSETSSTDSLDGSGIEKP